MTKIKVGVIGGAGYTAGELLRILIHHLCGGNRICKQQQQRRNPITDVHSGLIGETDLVFTSELPFGKVDALFLCSAHGDSKKFMDNNKVPPRLRLSTCPPITALKVLITILVYGLPELNHLANPKIWGFLFQHIGILWAIRNQCFIMLLAY